MSVKLLDSVRVGTFSVRKGDWIRVKYESPTASHHDWRICYVTECRETSKGSRILCVDFSTAYLEDVRQAINFGFSHKPEDYVGSSAKRSQFDPQYITGIESVNVIRD
jgi:hypothetical protein